MEKDDVFAKEFVNAKFQQGLPFDCVNSIFKEYGHEIRLFRDCETDFEQCPYMAIGVIPAPGDHWWLGRGDIQIYFTFSENQKLTSKFYEIYYPALH